MAACGQCEKPLSTWFVLFKRDDGFCSKECRAIADARKADASAAERHIGHLLQQLDSSETWNVKGLCLWRLTSSKAEDAVSLWAGRALFGIAGDILHTSSESRPSSIGIVGISESGTFALAPIGNLGVGDKLMPNAVNDAKIDRERSLKAPLHQIVVSQGREGTLIVKNEDRSTIWELHFPECFLDANDRFPILHKTRWRNADAFTTEAQVSSGGPIDAKAVRAAIEAANRGTAAAAAKCFADIPPKPLRNAIEAFAFEAAGEEILALVPSESSGKSGFVFTDMALYFRKWGYTNRYRFPYEEIVDVAQTKSLLRIATAQSAAEWDLDSENIVFWEKSRAKAAEFVVAVLAMLLRIRI